MFPWPGVAVKLCKFRREDSHIRQVWVLSGPFQGPASRNGGKSKPSWVGPPSYAFGCLSRAWLDGPWSGFGWAGAWLCLVRPWLAGLWLVRPCLAIVEPCRAKNPHASGCCCSCRCCCSTLPSLLELLLPCGSDAATTLWKSHMPTPLRLTT